ncbi:ribonuclease P protein component [Anaplasma capra]|uniref:ribonuclease P protein component n=1 Tax=Anaplasma capra TaxID=1562740 RepID=UPI0021D5BB0C|nr:ribonuclease P protein component [Anaplasma capra]MCU7611940.1 ribonuclease P protein component [Anaplasma capra]MCU7612806.1 ribonuclease P protein component [Anaplasma capra]
MRLRGVVTLKKRREFAHVRLSGRSASSGGLLLQAAKDPDNPPEGGGPVRIGFTVSKKSGNSVTRNRIRRRLRVVAQNVVATDAAKGFCYVLVSSSRLSEVRLGALQSSLVSCLGKLKLHVSFPG